MTTVCPFTVYHDAYEFLAFARWAFGPEAYQLFECSHLGTSHTGSGIAVNSLLSVEEYTRRALNDPSAARMTIFHSILLTRPILRYGMGLQSVGNISWRRVRRAD
ncbi:hypothetical protein EYZ11_013548 [Aspergillus tanneri]|uniref:Uncharacterized protein n=1 Tax=Aspergillus tanneri TaxID=1220188 RepID=A0A4S3IXM5_9EURO|nr:hypothetical protein EYZ11_013548 [Aspergillus tanneri]